MTIFRVHPGRNVNAFDVAAAEVPGEFPAVNLVRFAGFLFMLRWDIGGIDDHGTDSFFRELVVNPEATEAGFIYGMIGGSRKGSL
jgi:hypothetical protein